MRVIGKYFPIDYKAIKNASKGGHTQVVDVLLTNPTVEFLWACKKGDLETVKRLLADPRVTPSAQDHYGITQKFP